MLYYHQNREISVQIEYIEFSYSKILMVYLSIYTLLSGFGIAYLDRLFQYAPDK